MATKINNHQKIIEKACSVYPQDVMKTEKKNEILHALILQDRSLNLIQRWIEKIEDSKNQKFFTHRNVCSLSPLDCCALTNNEKVAKLLLEKGVSCTNPDPGGWTSIHYAYLAQGENSKVFLLFKQTTEKMNQTITSFFKDCSQSFCDLGKILGRSPAPREKEVAKIVQDGKMVLLTGQQFQQLTGAEFTDYILATPEGLLHDHLFPAPRSKDVDFLEMQKTLAQQLTHFREHRSALYLAFDPQMTLHPQGYDVYADQDFNSGDIVEVYAGKLQIDNVNQKSTYKLGSIDGKDARNLGPMINHGFPNVLFYVIHDQEGLSEVSVAVACEPIKKGQKILTNYGAHHEILYNKDRVFLGQENLFNFFSKNSPYEWLQTIQKWNKEFSTLNKEEKFKKAIEFESIFLKLKFLFEDPQVFEAFVKTRMAACNEKARDKFVLDLCNCLKCQFFIKLLQNPDLQIYIVFLQSIIFYHHDKNEKNTSYYQAFKEHFSYYF